MNPSFTSQLLDWYQTKARDLPWRRSRDAYAIWISEVMLQQTRVETVIPYFQRWMERFPTLQALAAAPLQEVLSAWEGLGYYSRARNLHQAAQIIRDEHGGAVPSDLADLRKLPGVGRYTAGAIASIAFGADEPALDGNIRRVLARAFNLDQPARSPQGEQRLWELAAEHLPKGRAGDYNQALMELGALVCTPRRPDCPSCPVAEFCQARLLGIQEDRPVSVARPSVPHYLVTAAVIERNGQVLITQRPLQGLLGGMWEFPGGKLKEGEDLPACLRREICEELNVKVNIGAPLGVYRHAYTHFRVTLYAFRCSLANGRQPEPRQVQDLRWVNPQDLDSFPMGKIDRLISLKLMEEAERR